MNIDLTSLGFSKEELQERVIDQIADSILHGKWYGEDGEEGIRDSHFKQELNKRILSRVDATINTLAERHVLPNVAQHIENLTIQQTNQWGERKGAPVTFVEYLVGRAQAYMQEEVNSDGKTRAEDNYSFTGKQTRITYLINKHLHRSIETAMKDSLGVAVGEIARGIHETARIKLNDIAASLKVAVTTK